MLEKDHKEHLSFMDYICNNQLISISREDFDCQLIMLVNEIF